MSLGRLDRIGSQLEGSAETADRLIEILCAIPIGSCEKGMCPSCLESTHP
jgi:hypothetical protein